MKIALYCRVSTDHQSVDMQIRELRKYCESRGFEIYREYIDSGVSGVKRNRPALDALMADAHDKKFDGVLVYRFDRFARSTKHLLEALETFKSLGIDFISYHENIDTTSPLGQAMFTIASAMAQLERDIIRERVISGLRNAKAKGKRLGRPKVCHIDRDQIMQLRSKNLTYRQIARDLGLSLASVYRAAQ